MQFSSIKLKGTNGLNNNSENLIETKLYEQAPNSMCFTYTRVPWSLHVRKEVSFCMLKHGSFIKKISDFTLKIRFFLFFFFHF
jgi:hypothetical protein